MNEEDIILDILDLRGEPFRVTLLLPLTNFKLEKIMQISSKVEKGHCSLVCLELASVPYIGCW